ncbi:MAG: molybdenum cofactor guanylyltransferase [Phycisphaerae bacterium]|nr:molybdenum cofactor guanylyltransferase [Phycisphaerae bacterium]NUQ47966.1 molybdenum cofactor guanylyltransferase [Phycisphaerae bacterium]
MAARDEIAALAPLHAGVLVGGASSRMGRPKALIELHGHTFLQRVVDALKPRFGSIVLLGDGQVPPACSALHRLADITDTKGPLAGMLAAMRETPHAAWLFVACDTPLLSAEAVAWMVAQRRSVAAAVLPRRGSDPPEPLPGIYEPAARERLESLLRAGRPSPRPLAGDADVLCPPVPDALLRCWRNVNTPEDLAALIADGSDCGTTQE